jgi:hypothetical protein
MCVLLQLWQDHATRGAVIQQHMHGQQQQSERCSVAAGGGSTAQQGTLAQLAEAPPTAALQQEQHQWGKFCITGTVLQ